MSGENEKSDRDVPMLLTKLTPVSGWHCPRCDHSFGHTRSGGYYIPKYCSECGQRVWPRRKKELLSAES